MRHVHELTLLWLATRPEGRGTVSKLRQALAPLLRERLSSADAAAAVDEALTAAAAAAELERGRGSLVLSDAGRARATELFGLDAWPKLTWRRARETLLPRHALGLAGDGKGGSDGLRAAVLVRAHGLDERAGRSLPRARDQLLWKLLGVDRQEPFTHGAVVSFLLGRALGSERTLKPEVALEQLAAQAVGARRREARLLAAAIIDRWLSDGATAIAQPLAVAAPENGHGPTSSWPDQPEQLAARILDTARGMHSGRFGDDKVFVSHLFRELHPPYASLDRFKEELLELHRERHLTLSRADLVEAMNPRDVAESEIRQHNATFHFVRLS